jgi:hypothetical protein
MSIKSLSENFQTLNFLSNAGGRPEDYPPIIHELVSKYIEGRSKKDQPKLNAFKILEVNEQLPAIKYQKVKLEIKMSTIPNAGLGIFAVEYIEKGKVIGSYGGPLPVLNTEYLKKKINLGDGALSRWEYKEESGFNEKQKNYTMKIPVRNDMNKIDYYFVSPSKEQLKRHEELVTEYKISVDPKHLKNISKNMNWTALINDACDPFKNNVKVIENGYLNTDKEIQPGEELFLEYGSEYWEDEKTYVTLDVFNTICKNFFKISKELSRIDSERAGQEDYPIYISDSEPDPDSMSPFSKRFKLGGTSQKAILNYFSEQRHF